MEQEQYDKLVEMLQSKNSDDQDLALSVINNLEGNFILEMQKESLRKIWMTIKHFEQQEINSHYYMAMERRLFYGVQ